MDDYRQFVGEGGIVGNAIGNGAGDDQAVTILVL